LRVIVVGGGISGLATAYLCAKRGMAVTVYEKGQPGGKIHSAHEDGFLLEHGPQGFLDSVPESLTLASELGLEPLRANESAKKRFLYFRGQLQRVPESPPLLLKSRILSLRGKARLAWEPFAKKRTEPDETVMAFATRRLGLEAAERLVAPMVAGIYAGDAERLSIDSALPRVAKLERDHGSLIRAMRRLKAAGPGPRGTLTSFKGGMGDVIDALLGKLGPAVVRAHVRSIERDGKIFRVRTDDSGPAPADAVVLATPGYATASLVPNCAPLSEIPYAPVDVAFLGYPRDAVPHPLDGFGFLVALGEDLRVLGCLWESSIFPFRAPDGNVLFRLMLGGARDPGVAGLAPPHVLSLAREALEKSVGVRAEPRLSRLVRHPRGIPQYTVGHAARVASATAAEAAWPGLYLTGNALRGVGYNDCVREAYAIAERVAHHAG
jgi:oxygen-dependent protoporphyrinogen oxidase